MKNKKSQQKHSLKNTNTKNHKQLITPHLLPVGRGRAPQDEPPALLQLLQRDVAAAHVAAPDAARGAHLLDAARHAVELAGDVDARHDDHALAAALDLVEVEDLFEDGLGD